MACMDLFSQHHICWWPGPAAVQNIRTHIIDLICPKYTWMIHPSLPFGRDLNLFLNESREGADTTSSGRPFHMLITCWEKKSCLTLVLHCGLKNLLNDPYGFYMVFGNNSHKGSYIGYAYIFTHLAHTLLLSADEKLWKRNRVWAYLDTCPGLSPIQLCLFIPWIPHRRSIFQQWSYKYLI